MTRLVTAPAFVPIGTVSSFMGTFADGTLKWLTSIPDTTRITLDVTLERYVVVQRHTHNAGTGGYVLKTRETLQSYLVHGPKWQKGQTKPHIACLDRQVVHIHACHWGIRCSNIKEMDIINLNGLTIKNFITVFYRRKSHTNATPRNKLNVADFGKVQLF